MHEVSQNLYLVTKGPLSVCPVSMIPEVSTHASFVSILTETAPFLIGSFPHVASGTRLYQTPESCATVCLTYTLPCHHGLHCISPHVRTACEVVASKTSPHFPMPPHTPSSLRTLCHICLSPSAARSSTVPGTIYPSNRSGQWTVWHPVGPEQMFAE